MEAYIEVCSGARQARVRVRPKFYIRAIQGLTLAWGQLKTFVRTLRTVHAVWNFKTYVLCNETSINTQRFELIHVFLVRFVHTERVYLLLVSQM